jgi:hypothetical protein
MNEKVVSFMMNTWPHFNPPIKHQLKLSKKCSILTPFSDLAPTVSTIAKKSVGTCGLATMKVGSDDQPQGGDWATNERSNPGTT